MSFSYCIYYVFLGLICSPTFIIKSISLLHRSNTLYLFSWNRTYVVCELIQVSFIIVSSTLPIFISWTTISNIKLNKTGDKIIIFTFVYVILTLIKCTILFWKSELVYYLNYARSWAYIMLAFSIDGCGMIYRFIRDFNWITLLVFYYFNFLAPITVAYTHVANISGLKNKPKYFILLQYSAYGRSHEQ